MTGRRLLEAGTALALIWAVVAAPRGALATARTSHSAARIWSAEFDGVGKLWDYAVGAVPSPDGSLVFVTGRSWGGASEDDYVTVAYDAITGTPVWRAVFNSSSNSLDDPTKLAVSPDGTKLLVTGISWRGYAHGYDYVTVAYDASTGATLWVSSYDQAASDIPTAIQVSPDSSTVFVSGNGSNPSTGDDYATIAYDSTTGAQLWTALFNGPGNGYDQASALQVSPDGANVYVTGHAYFLAGQDDYLTVAYDAATGAQTWTARFNGPDSQSDYATALGISADGTKVYVTGQSYSLTTLGDYVTIAYDAATGSSSWVARFNGPANQYDFPVALAVSPDGSRVFVTGESDQARTSGDYVTIAYDTSTGTRAWIDRFDGGTGYYDTPTALGVSPEGSTVYLTGYSYSPVTAGDYLTLAYSSSDGAPIWRARVPNRGDDRPAALAVAPDGSRVYVTGYIQVSFEGRTDYLTIAYDA